MNLKKTKLKLAVLKVPLTANMSTQQEKPVCTISHYRALLSLHCSSPLQQMKQA